MSVDRPYAFGVHDEVETLINAETFVSTAKRLRQKLQRLQSGPIGPRTSSVGSSESSQGGTPVLGGGRTGSFHRAAVRDASRELQQMLLQAMHAEDCTLLEKLLLNTTGICEMVGSDSTATLTELAQGRHGVPRSLAPSPTVKLSCMFKNTLHMAILHKQLELVDVLLRSGVDPNLTAACTCNECHIVIRPKSGAGLDCKVCQSFNSSIFGRRPLALAVQVQSSDLINLLCSNGARPNEADQQGNSSLLLAVKDSPVSWTCVETLLFHGAQIYQMNNQGVCPLDLAPELSQFRTFCIDELTNLAWNLNASNCSPADTPSPHRVSVMSSVVGHNTTHRASLAIPNWRHSLASTSTDCSGVHGSNSPTAQTADNLGRIFKQRAVPTVSIASADSPTHRNRRQSVQRKSIGSSFHQRYKNPKEIASHPHDNLTPMQAWSALQQMVKTSECLIPVANALLKRVQSLRIDIQSTAYLDALDRNLTLLLHKMLLTALEEFDRSFETTESRKNTLASVFASLCQICIELFTNSNTHLEFTALSTMNKMIDANLVLAIIDIKSIWLFSSQILGKHRTCDFENNASLFDSAFMAAVGQMETTDESLFLKSISSFNPNILLTILHNSITMQNREPGNRAVCTPSHRWRQCMHHCIQILSARLLLFLCHLKPFKDQISEKNNLRAFIQLLDPTLDPQLICLLLQSLALLALNPKNHLELCELQIDDALIQMLLPADDWYYTNHSTKYGKFVKHHAARILVYVGLGDRVGSRINLFSMLSVSKSSENGTQQNYPSEDDYICKTCFISEASDLAAFSAVSPEQLLLNVLAEVKEINKRCKERSNEDIVSLIPMTEDKDLQLYLAKLSFLIDPSVLLRVLLHKLSWDHELVVVRKTSSSATYAPEFAKQKVTKAVSLSPRVGKSKSFDRRENSRSPSLNSASRLSPGGTKKKVRIRRTSSVQIFRPKRLFSYGKNNKTAAHRHSSQSSTKSIPKALPKYLHGIFRTRFGTDPSSPTKRKKFGESKSNRKKSNQENDGNDDDSSSSDSEAVTKFAKKLQNYPIVRREPIKPERKTSTSIISSPMRTRAKTTTCSRDLVPRLHIVGASPPNRSPPKGSTLKINSNSIDHLNINIEEPLSPGNELLNMVPQIEIRRPSLSGGGGQQIAYTEYDYAYDIGSPRDSDCQPLFSPFSPTQSFDSFSRKSSEESRGNWSRKSSSGSRGSSCVFGVSPAGTSIGSDGSGPYMFTFLVRRRASTISTMFPVAKQRRTASGASKDSLQVPGLLPMAQQLAQEPPEMSPEFQLMRQLVAHLLKIYTKGNKNVLMALKETADLLRQILNQPQDPEVKNWCVEIIDVVTLQEPESEPDEQTDEQINDEYMDLQDQVTSGCLPCPKEEAALLAAIQLCVEENWPTNKRTQSFRRNLIRGQFGRIRDLATKIMVTPWEVDQNLYCTPPRTNASESRALVSVAEFKTTEPRWRSAGILSRCMNNPDFSLSAEAQMQCLPPDLRGDKRTMKLIKERKRKLFHSQVYESEIGMKNLYIQTCKKLSAYGCKIFQVKELTHGKTLKKTVRLLCIGAHSVSLLDSSTKVSIKHQSTNTLQQWRVGGGDTKHQVQLEFRGSKWQFVAPSPVSLKAISMTLWEIMQSNTSPTIPNSFAWYRSLRPSADQASSSEAPVAPGFILGDEPITLYRVELERLQYIFHFPEEVAYQLSLTEYDLFYSGIQPMDYVRYVSCDLTSIPVIDNPSPLKNLVKRFCEVSSWITHVIISQPTHEDRKAMLGCILRTIESCWNIGNFNAAVELLMGLRSEKLRPFWLSLKSEEKQQYESMCEVLLPSNSALPSSEYIDAVQRAMQMPQAQLIPFFGTFLRDLYAIVNDVPSLVVIGHHGDRQKLEFVSDYSGEDHFTSRIGVGGLLNAEKISLVGVVLENLEKFWKHYRQEQRLVAKFVAQRHNPEAQKNASEIVKYEPVQSVPGASHGITLIPMDTARLDLDIIQRLQHGTTAIHYDPESTRSMLCRIYLDPSCGAITWQKFCGPQWQSSKDPTKEVQVPRLAAVMALTLPTTDTTAASAKTSATNSTGDRTAGGLEEGFVKLSCVKAVERVDSWDVDIDGIYRRHSMEEMSVPVHCWRLCHGSFLSENEFLYFIAPEKIAHYWAEGLQQVIGSLQEQHKAADRRALWLKKLFLDMYYDADAVIAQRLRGSTASVSAATNADTTRKRCTGPKPHEALQAFGGRVERWKDRMGSLPSAGSGSALPNSTNEFGSTSNFKRFTNTIKRKVGGRSKSPTPIIDSPLVQSQSPKPRYGKQRSSVKSNKSTSSTAVQSTTPAVPAAAAPIQDYLKPHDSDDGDDVALSIRSRQSTATSVSSLRSRGSTTISVSSVGRLGAREFHDKPMCFGEFVELYKAFTIRMRKDIREIFNEYCTTSPASSAGHAHEFTQRSESVKSRDTVDEDGVNFMPADVLTRNCSWLPLSDKQQKIYNALALASVHCNCAVDTSRTATVTPAALKNFMATHQFEAIDETDAIELIQEHEPDAAMRARNQMSFEGFARFLLDSRNFAFAPEQQTFDADQLQHPLSYYYIASSHNTYLTGHQLKGESSTELYRQVLLTGCRCVELDCWDGDDGLPLIYHGHTFTSKISFKHVVDVVKKSAFETSSLPVILSIENHCSLQQQTKMAQMFKTVFGDKLVTQFMFEQDYSESPRLPSPMQLQYKILIKNKKMIAEPLPGLTTSLTSTLDPGKEAVRKTSRNSYSYGSNTGIDEGDDDYDFDDDMADLPDEDEPEDVERAASDPSKPPVDAKALPLVLSGRADSFSSDASAGTTPRSGPKSIEQTPNNLQQPQGDTLHTSTEDEGILSASMSSARSMANRKTGTQQLAPDLSDLVIYCQAVKFKGFPPMVDESPVLGASKKALEPTKPLSATPTSSRKHAAVTALVASQTSGAVERSISTQSNPSSSALSRRSGHRSSCYQVASLNETVARKLCRKHPQKLISYSKEHVVRTYPGGMRIDSSNFNPVQFWMHGLQMVALNYQTPDVAMAVNAALFERSANCGYALKPRVLWDPAHPLYGKFNPWSKEYPSLSGVHLTLTVISGQHICPNQHVASCCIEIEIIGIPADCNKEKTKTIQRNAVNPIFDQSFQFRVNFVEFTFIRFAVIESGSGKCVAQRLIPLSCLRAGYRHVRLRSPTNGQLDQAMLFIHSKQEIEEYVNLDDEQLQINPDVTADQHQAMTGRKSLPLPRRQIFVLKIYGMYPDDNPVVLQATSDSNVRSVIAAALMACGKANENADDYIMFEEEPEASETTESQCQRRMLPASLHILDAVASWNGSIRRFVIRKKGSDPSSRAWISAMIRGSGTTERPRATTVVESSVKSRHPSVSHTESDSVSSHNKRLSSIESTFLVCIHNVSENRPYAILRVPITSTAQDAIAQVLLKARRMEDPEQFILIEEIPDESATPEQQQKESTPRKGSHAHQSHGGGMLQALKDVGMRVKTIGEPAASSSHADSPVKHPVTKSRVLSPNENLHTTQSHWKTAGRFVLQNRQETVAASLMKSDELAVPESSSRKVSLCALNFPKMPKFTKSSTNA